MNILYDLIFIIFGIFYLLFFLLRGRRRKGIALRFGIYPEELVKKLKERPNIWVHAVSVGEVMAVSPLVSLLRSAYPGCRIVLTTVTETGNEVARKIAKEHDIVLYLPLDISFIVKKALSCIRPKALIITETEIWPNLICSAASLSVPVLLVNGRISEKSFGRYSLVKFMLKPVLDRISLFLMQTDADKDRIISLGAANGSVLVSGNMKFDSAVMGPLSDEDKNMLRSSLGLGERDRLIVAGSTHPGEEEILLAAYKELRNKHGDAKLLIAPRHVDRAAEIEKLAQKSGIKTVLCSRIFAPNPAAGSREPAADHVFILDTIGRLKNFYSIADVVFVGGSLIKKGGQNMIEPACFAKPIMFGPHTFNFKDISELFVKEKAALVAVDGRSLLNGLLRILDDAELSGSLGSNAKKIVDSNKGASQAALKALGGFIK